MSSKAEAFEHWIRTSFVQMNTELENLYFANEDRAQVIGCGDPIKTSLRDEGHTHVIALLAEGNTGEGFDSAYGVLGSVGLYRCAAAARTDQSRARRAVTVSRGVIACPARRCIFGHGAAILHRAPSDVQPSAGWHSQELHFTSGRIPIY